MFRNGRRILRKGLKMARRAIRKRYTTKGRGGARKINMSRVIKDIGTLKALVNVEKKRFNILKNSQILGQVNYNSNAYVSYDITPAMAQGDGYGTRNGSSIKVVSFYHKFQFWQQANHTHNTMVSIDYFLVSGAPQVSSTFASTYFQPDPHTGLLDYGSPKDPDYYGTVRKLLTRRFSVSPNSTGINRIVNVAIGRKIQHHVRFNDDGTTVTNGQIICVIRADSGNVGATNSTISNIPISQASTGLLFNANFIYYYVDN